MTTLFVISVVLLAVSVFFNVRFYQIAREYQAAYLREKRAHTVDNLLSILSSVACLALVWLSKREDAQ